MQEHDDAGKKEEPRYRAPALEKGLDILELISQAATPLPVPMIAGALKRSPSELFRMVQVLEYRGYISQSETGNGFVPTTKLFVLGMRQAPVHSVIEVALPVMRQLSEESDQSCHLAFRAEGDIVIAARMESAGLIGFSVRVGYRMAMPVAGSGAVLYAFQSEATQSRWRAMFDPALLAGTLEAFDARVRGVLSDGYGVYPSQAVPGIVDLSAPVLRGSTAAAALTLPFVEKPGMKADRAEALEMVRAAARSISNQLVAPDIRI